MRQHQKVSASGLASPNRVAEQFLVNAVALDQERAPLPPQSPQSRPPQLVSSHGPGSAQTSVDRLVCPGRRLAVALVWGAVHSTTVRRAAQGANSLKATRAAVFEASGTVRIAGARY